VFSWARNKSLKREFEKKILEHCNSLYNLAIRMTQNEQDAEDLVQEASLKAYRHFDKFKPGTNFKAWIMTIARNIYINCYRKKLKEPQKIEFEAVPNPDLVARILRELRLEEEKEKLEGRIR